MGTICEIFNKKSCIILGRNLLGPISEPFQGVPDQVNEYLMNVSREIFCDGRPFVFDPSDPRVGDHTFVNLDDGTVVDEDGNVLFPCFNEFIFSNLTPTLLFLESFVSKE
jgi:hypothetical protein